MGKKKRSRDPAKLSEENQDKSSRHLNEKVGARQININKRKLRTSGIQQKNKIVHKKGSVGMEFIFHIDIHLIIRGEKPKRG